MTVYRNLATSAAMKSFVFSVEDSVVSTVGLLSGIAFVGTSRSAILVTGVVLIFVEAFSMAVGDLVSDNTVREIRTHQETSLRKSVGPAVVMFLSYLVSGFLVLLPYVVFAPFPALPVSIALSLIMLFALGLLGGRLSGTSLMRNGLTMASVGGAAIVIGVIAGFLLQYFGGQVVF